MSSRLLVVAHAPSDNTRLLRDALLRGARHPDMDGVETACIAPLEAGADDLLAAQAVILFTTENFGYMSGALKDFFDRVYYPCLENTQGLPYALCVRAGNDGSGAIRSVERIVAGLRWQRVQETVLCRGQFNAECVEHCEELGMAMAAGLEAGIY